MSKSQSPDLPCNPSAPDTEHPWSACRDRVRERMREMARLACLAATPLANTACDPPPEPPLCEHRPADWLVYRYPEVRVAWGEDSGERIVLVDLDPRLASSNTCAGGSLLAPDSDQPGRLRIRPDAGAPVITLDGTMTCQSHTAPIRITIDLAPRDGGTSPVAKVSLQD